MDPVTVTWPVWVRVLLWGGIPAAGAGLGWAVLHFTHVVERIPFLPLDELLLLLRELPEPWTSVAAVTTGVAAGLVLAALCENERPVVRISRADVSFQLGDTGRTAERSGVTAVFRDGKHLVIQDRTGSEVLREEHDLEHEDLAEAFRSQGWPWRDDGDPYAEHFHRWVEGAHGLPPGADAVLRARQRALDKGEKKDLGDLRAELARLGVVVRDEDGRQYWRAVRPQG